MINDIFIDYEITRNYKKMICIQLWEGEGCIIKKKF